MTDVRQRANEDVARAMGWDVGDFVEELNRPLARYAGTSKLLPRYAVAQRELVLKMEPVIALIRSADGAAVFQLSAGGWMCDVCSLRADEPHLIQHADSCPLKPFLEGK